MQLGKIVGTVVSTSKDEKLEGLKFHIVKHVDIDGKPTGSFVIAVDSVGAGVGEIVLVAAGSSARQTDVTKDKPVDSVIMAIVDELEIDGETRYLK
jgi:microcompartment protein CcmK/EutM